MRYSRFQLLLLLIVGLLGSRCATKANRIPERGLDRGVARDGIQPPDLGSRDGLRVGNVGKSCDPKTGQGCTGQAECLQVSAAVAFCAIPNCKEDDITTPGIEDDCPLLPELNRRSICTKIQVQFGDGGFKTLSYCLPECKASPTQNDCAAVNNNLTCDPVTLLLNGHAEVCLMPACTKNADCGKDPVKPGATCDVDKSSTCQVTGKPGVLIGSACLLSSDCGPGQFCLPEYTDSKSGKVILSGGYCTIVGCAHEGLWNCPSGSKCFLLGPSQALSLCLATGCDYKATDPQHDGCRDEAPLGQYSCTLQNEDGKDYGVCWVNTKQPAK